MMDILRVLVVVAWFAFVIGVPVSETIGRRRRNREIRAICARNGWTVGPDGRVRFGDEKVTR